MSLGEGATSRGGYSPWSGPTLPEAHALLCHPDTA